MLKKTRIWVLLLFLTTYGIKAQHISGISPSYSFSIQSPAGAAYKEAIALNTIEALELCLEKKPLDTLLITDAIQRIYKITAENGRLTEYQNFLKKYPDSQHAATVRNRLYEMLDAIGFVENKLVEQFSFLEKFPKTAIVAQDSFLASSTHSMTWESFDQNIYTHTEEREKIARLLYLDADKAKINGNKSRFNTLTNVLLHSPFFIDTEVVFHLMRDQKMVAKIQHLKHEIKQLQNTLLRD